MPRPPLAKPESPSRQPHIRERFRSAPRGIAPTAPRGRRRRAPRRLASRRQALRRSAAATPRRAAPPLSVQARRPGSTRSGGEDVPREAPFGIGAGNPYRGKRRRLRQRELVLLSQLEQREERDGDLDAR